MHPPDARKVSRKGVMTNIKRMASSTSLAARDIITESLRDVKKATIAVVPPMKQLANRISKIRQDPKMPKNPNSLSELVLSEDYCTSENGESFILHDTGVDDAVNRVIIFGTKTNLTFLTRCEELFMDGTFSITPPLFKQVYTIHGNVYHFLWVVPIGYDTHILILSFFLSFYSNCTGRLNGWFIPLVYASSTDRKQGTYEMIFNALVALEPNIKPAHITIDFEMAVIKAIKNIFQSTKVHGCYFHFSQTYGSTSKLWVYPFPTRMMRILH